MFNDKDYTPNNEYVYKDAPSLIEVFRNWCKSRSCRGCPARGRKGKEGWCYVYWLQLPAEKEVTK